MFGKIGRISHYALLLSILAGAALLIAVTGCSGGDGVRTGTVAGWVFIGPDDYVMISADRTPPSGFTPVSGARVEVEGYSNLFSVTDSNGRYTIPCVPPGLQTIVVTIGERELDFPVQVTAGQVVFGGGHVEGGGEL
ncbi:MAG: carboxypeptidase-like regulatory domain-containing protein [Armatimonadota bacterium]